MPRKTLKQQRAEQDLSDLIAKGDEPILSDDRISPIKDKINAEQDVEDRMMLIMDTLKYTVTPVPDQGKYYTFLYKAKTKDLKYDQHPLIECLEVFRWGFRGYNIHFKDPRNYTWAEMQSNLYEVTSTELPVLTSISYAKYIRSPK